MSVEDKQMTSKQHAVPQNIMDVEFKLIGDLTMRQFTYLLIFGLAAYFNAQLVVGLFRLPITLFLGVLGVVLAFLSIQERSMDEWIVNFIRAVYTPTQRIWKKFSNVPSAFLQDSLNVVRQELITLAPTSSRRKLEEYLDYQSKDAPKDPLDIPEADFILKVRDAYKDLKPEPTGPVIGVKTIPPERITPIVQQPEEFKPIIKPKEFKEELPVQKEEKEKPKEIPKIIVKEEKPVEEIKPKIPEIPKVVIEKETSVLPKHVDRIEEKIEKTKEVRETEEEIIPKIELPKNVEDTMMVTPMTPDRHAGRKFTSFLPSEGELILPIRGERVLKTSEELEIDKKMKEKEERLQEMLSKEQKTKPKTLPPLKEKREVELTKKIEEVEEIEEKELETKIEKEDEGNIVEKDSEEEKVSRSYTPIDFEEKAVFINTPNVVSGYVRNITKSPIEGVVVIVKNERGEPVRATKTNTLGRFSLATPLVNGKYTVEVSPSNKTDLSFAIISIEAKGEVISPLQLVGK